MNGWGKRRTAGLVCAVAVVLAAFGSVPANAATEQDMAAWITDSTLNQLNVAAPDAELAATLNSAIAQALAGGLISAQTQALAESAVDDPDLVDAEAVADTLDDGLADQGEVWDDASAAWHVAFDEIKADFAECRQTAEGGADLCAHQFRYELQVHHVTAWLARHTAKVGDISALPAEEQAAALAKLERQGELAAARLERARIQLEKKTGQPVDDALTDDELSLLDGLTTDGHHAKPDTDKKADKTGKRDKAEKGDKGNRNGNGNGKNAR